MRTAETATSRIPTPTLADWLASAEASLTIRGDDTTPIVSLRRLTRYGDVDRVLRSSDFVQAGGGHRASAPMTLHTVVSLSGDAHFDRRRLESNLFSRSALKRLERDVLKPAIAAELDRDAEPSSDGVVHADLLTLARRVFIRIAAAVVGIDGLDERDAVDHLLACADRMSDGHNVDWSTTDRDQVLRAAVTAKREFVERYFAASWQRRAQMPRSSAPPDLLTAVIGSANHFSQWDRDTVVREAALFLTGVIGSPVRALPYIVDDLANWIDCHPDERRRLDDPSYLRRIVSESLRLHTPGEPKLRRATRDTTLPSGVHVHAGETVAADIAAANRDRDVFGANADDFDPTRNVVSAPPFGVAFGGGAHTCIGLTLTIGTTARDGPAGALVRLLVSLYRRGMSKDPDRPPERHANHPKRFATFPIRLYATTRT